MAARIRARDASWTSFSFEEHSFRVGQSFVGNAALALVAAGQLFSSSASQCSYAATRVEAEGCRPEFPLRASSFSGSCFCFFVLSFETKKKIVCVSVPFSDT